MESKRLFGASIMFVAAHCSLCGLLDGSGWGSAGGGGEDEYDSALWL